MNLAVTCRCTRRMRQEVGRPAGYLFCTCGTRVRIDDQQHTACHGRDRDGEPCDLPLVMTHPIALCRPHVFELARSETFMSPAVTEQQRVRWRAEQDVKSERERQTIRLQQLRREEEERLRQAQLDGQAVVYYIALRGCIKIGYTTNMKARMGVLVPDAVLATEPGDPALEKRRHRQFKHLRAPFGSEYFSVHPELLAHIETVIAEHGEPKITGYPKYHTWHLGDHMLVPVKEGARLAGITEGRLYEWIREQRLTVTRPQGRARGMLVNALEVQELAGMQRNGRLPRVDRAG